MLDEPVDYAPILLSKLAVPPLPEGMIARPRLTERLAAGASKPVTVLAAPAGSGKTALLADWAEHFGSARPLAWLSIDPGDDDERFWHYLCEALSIKPELGGGLRSPGDPFLAAAIADLLSRRTEPVVLVLDGAQNLRDHELMSGLEFLLQHAAGKLHLIVATREAPRLPLHRWRLVGDLTEISARDLAFTITETAQLLSQMGLRLPADAVHALHEHTEGWAAGIRFDTASLSGGDGGYAAAFLQQEVIDGHPPEFAETLAAVSIGDHLNGALFDSLTGRCDGVAVLEQLEHAGMFVEKLDQSPWTHRLHRMFAETLRARLRSSATNQIPQLHIRAARWHVANELPGQALHHALSGHDQELAVAIARDNWPQMILAGHPTAAMTERAAAPRREADAGPMLALALAADHIQAHDVGGASRCLRLAERRRDDISRGPQRECFALISAAFHMALAHARGDTAAVTSSAATVMAMSQDNDAGRASVLTLLGYAQLADGDTNSALETLRKAVDEAEISGSGCCRLAARSTLALGEAMHGRLGTATTTAHQALGLPACTGQPSQVHRAPALLALATVELQRGDPEGAQSYLVAATSACDSELQPRLAISIACALAQSLGDQGDLAGAHEALIDGYRRLERTNLPRDTLAHELVVATAELHTAHGDARTARSMLSSLPQDGSATVALATARACLGDGDAGAAIRALPLHDGDGTGWPLALRLDAAMLRALASHRLGERRHASDALETTLGLAETEGFRRVFVRAGQAGRRLLADHLDMGTAHWPLVQTLIGLAEPPRTPDRTPRAEQAPMPPLSSRELTVLRYLQGALSNPEIAAELSVSVNTVKTHVHSIYRKLEVTARREAVKRARDLRLL